MLNLNLFNNRNISNDLPKKNNDFINILIEELKNALKNIRNEGIDMNQKKNISNEPNSNEENDVMEEYNLYETRKIFLDNKSWKGNDFAWIMDDKSVCLSKHGDGGPYSISEIDLPKNAKVGEVYEKIDGKYVYNSKITAEINKIEK